MPFPEGESEFYEPGDPDSFGKPPRPPTPEEWEEFLRFSASFYSDPENFLKLFHGQDPAFNAALKTISRDRFLSAFPSLEKGVVFTLENLPLILKEYGIQESLTVSSESLPFYDDILSSFWKGDEQAEVGGMETLYIFLDRPPETQSYEYIGEKIGRAIRRQFHKDRSYKTQAFFGWIGRHLMKKVCPETDFSFDCHNERVKKEKTEVREFFRQVREQIEKGVEGEVTPEKVYELFGELYWQFPSLGSSETPLWYRIANNLHINFWGFDSVRDYMPTRPDAYSGETFEKFWQNWQKAAEIGIPEVDVWPPWEDEFRKNRLQEEGLTSYETWLADLQDLFSQGKLINPRARDYYGGLEDLLGKYEKEILTELPQEEVIAWYTKVETQSQRKWKNSNFYYWRRNFRHIFGELLDDPEKMASASKEELVPCWFEMLRYIILTELEWIAKDAEEFETSYFRFIENDAVAEGYAFAQEHIKEIMANLPETVKMPEEEIHRRFLSGKAKILGGPGDRGDNTADDRYRRMEDKSDELFSFVVSIDRKKPQEIIDWSREICYGPNAKLYEQLKSFEFTKEQRFLGIFPLFFGFHLSDAYAQAFLSDRLGEFFQEMAEKSPLEVEQERIEELKAGIFSLPQTAEDLIKNASLQIERLKREKVSSQIHRRIEVIEEVKEILEELIQKGLLKLEEPSD